MVFIKGNFALNDGILFRFRILVEKAVNQVAFEYRLLHDIRDIILMNANIIDASGVDHHQSSFFAKARATGLFDLYLLFQAL
ncbi:MAG TPA: hypothetical protein PLV49_05395, partial [Methanothrix soehngenii]|nr:hypothetical protein [Methanothrix soehngenii]